MNGSCHAYERGMAHVCRSYGTQLKTSHHTYVWMSHVTHMDASCRACECEFVAHELGLLAFFCGGTKTNAYIIRKLSMCKKRPVYMSKEICLYVEETHPYVKRDLFMYEKRPMPMLKERLTYERHRSMNMHYYS